MGSQHYTYEAMVTFPFMLDGQGKPKYKIFLSHNCQEAANKKAVNYARKFKNTKVVIKLKIKNEFIVWEKKY